ncbi:unnamed protein product [Rhizophagus irregularis]|nr:unnamed protein product [Rhizophagus irregularis]CAB4426501.1 unnamed protein product [Rhizophagus irregularis]
MALSFSYTAEIILAQLSDEDKEADEDKELLYPIALETDWTKLDEWFNNHGLEQGFTHSEKDKEDGLP